MKFLPGCKTTAEKQVGPGVGKVERAAFEEPVETESCQPSVGGNQGTDESEEKSSRHVRTASLTPRRFCVSLVVGVIRSKKYF